MKTPGWPRLPPTHLVLSWIEAFLNGLPRQTRQELQPASAYLSEVMQALEQACEEGSPAMQNPEGFVKEQMAAIAFKELLDPARPIDDPWVLGQAAAIAAQVLRARDRELRHRYGDLIDVAAAKAIGWVSLIALGKQMWDGEEIKNPQAYLRTIIKNDLEKTIDLAMRAAYPGARAYRHLLKREEKLLRETRRDLGGLERRALAATRADEKLKRAGGLLDRVAEDGIGSIEDAIPGLFQQVFDAWMVEEIDRLVAGEPCFTETDRDTWARFKAADFSGKEIDWRDLPDSHAGYQRLYSLLKKLRDLLDDWPR